MGREKNFVKKHFAVLFLLPLFTNCTLLDLPDFGSSADTSSHGSIDIHNGVDSSGVWGGSGKNKLQTKESSDDSRLVKVDLPDDRCHAGTISFGVVEGKQVSCSALGRGVTRYWDHPPSVYNFSCMGSPVHTVASDWQHGQGCWFLKENKRCGATPRGRYAIPAFGGSRERWGSQQSLIMVPRFETSRGGLLVHTDDRFGGGGDFIEHPTHSTAGCLKLAPDCQKLFVEFKRQHGGLEMMVN